MFLSPRPMKLLAVAALSAVIFLPFYLFSITGPKTRGFHYLVPTTATNPEVCKLVLSGAITNWPEPVFLGWDGRGRWNGSESHLFKLSETVRYLDTLRKEQDDDLVLVLDAFDVWLQLPPQVMIERYFRALDKQNNRLRNDGIWNSFAKGVRVQNTVLFGADKFCWPRGGDRPKCWSAPPSPMPADALGPDSDTRDFTVRPRFVNSGTIMGPVKDVRDVFNAALWKIDNEWSDSFYFRNSDQHYLSNVWGEQEAERMRLAGGEAAIDEAKKQEVLSKRDEVSSTALTQKYGRTEFHMAVDHESDAFQIHNFYSKYIAFMTFNHTTPTPKTANKPKSYPAPRIDRLELDATLAAMPGPFSAGKPDDGLPTERSWRDVMLGTNTLTGNVLPLYHITGEKAVRAWWWPRMWFHPFAESLLVAARRQRLEALKAEPRDVVADVRGVKYLAVDAHNGKVEQIMLAKDATNTKGGAWNDLGDYMPWDKLCKAHENDVFLTDGFK